MSTSRGVALCSAHASDEQCRAIAIGDGWSRTHHSPTRILTRVPLEPHVSHRRGRPATITARRRVTWPFAATMLCASLLGIGLAYCARALSIPVWGLDGGGASLLPADVVCSSGNSSTSPQTTRTDE